MRKARNFIEYNRYRYLKAFEEHSTYSSEMLLEHLVESSPYTIECIQTDNGFEFTNSLNSRISKKTLFEVTLAKLGIKHKLIRPYTPRYNGKVECYHRKDNEKFYTSHTFYSFDDFKKAISG